ncbi:hypothetical protein ACPB8Q_01515 [Methanocaldococcus indicus]|uniref:hypothetical protein n=1 Tax=Methanocaldococcus indicus TaxID=213231 RepID=UPI003C6D4600
MKKYIIVLILILILNVCMSYYINYIKVNEESPNKSITFTINKVEIYSYKMSFVHYGNINKNMKVNIYLNGNLIYVIDDSNDGSGNYKKNVTIDITNYLKNGKNTLRVEGMNLIGNDSYHPYYVVKDININEPIKTPINFELMIFSLLIIGLIIVKLSK